MRTRLWMGKWHRASWVLQKLVMTRLHFWSLVVFTMFSTASKIVRFLKSWCHYFWSLKGWKFGISNYVFFTIRNVLRILTRFLYNTMIFERHHFKLLHVIWPFRINCCCLWFSNNDSCIARRPRGILSMWLLLVISGCRWQGLPENQGLPGKLQWLHPRGGCVVQGVVLDRKAWQTMLHLMHSGLVLLENKTSQQSWTLYEIPQPNMRRVTGRHQDGL